jgi:3,4-dihydroxy 2-butanone 4-phosphate synthase/GTP cyclohydrolase II
MKQEFATIPEAIEELKKGKMLIVVDRPDRENQGDIILPAEMMTAEKANFLIKECRGMFCVLLTQAKAVQLDLPLMVAPQENTEKLKCKFTISVDAKDVTSFGISASDRALTVKTMVKPSAVPTDLVRPGHVFPIMAVDGGVLERDGHTEAAIDLARLAGFAPMGVLSEILREDGEPARVPDLKKFAKKHNLKIITIVDLVNYLKNRPLPERTSPSIFKTAQSFLPTDFGNFTIHVYKSIKDNREHVALVMGDCNKISVPTRIHSQCITGDTFHSQKCDCGEQLHKSLEMIKKKGKGILLYLNQEGRGIGLTNKIKAYALQEKGLDTVEANEALDLPIDGRDYKIAAEILCDLDARSIQLLTNNPDKVEQLEMYGVEITERVPLEVEPNKFNEGYLKTKKKKFHHQLTEV